MADKRYGQGCALSVEALEAKQLLAADCGLEDAPAVEAAASVADTSVTPLDVGETTQIALPTDLPEQFTTTIDFEGQTLTLELDKNSVFGENTKFLIDDGSGQLVEVEGVDRSYLGQVAEHPDYVVSGVLSPNGLSASIIRPGLKSIVIDPSHATPGVHFVSLAADVAHDHDGDGIPDHTAEEHQNETDGGHPPGCTCAGCCGETSSEPADQETAASVDPITVDPQAPAEANGPSGDGGPSTATLPPTRVMNVYEFEVGVDVGTNALQNNYGSGTTAQKVATAMAEVQKIPGNLDARYLHSTGIKHRLGTIIIRTDGDPFTVSNGNDTAGLNAFRSYWNSNPGIVGNTHDLAVFHIRSAPSGLAFVGTAGTSSGYALSASNGPSSWADGTLAHEFGHSWNLPHVNDGRNIGMFYENRPRNNNGSTTAGGRDDYISPMDGSGDHNIGRLATDEALRVLARRNIRLGSGDLISDPGEVKPFGHRDELEVGLTPVVFDVIANDYDVNNDVLDVELLDTVSFLGGTISLSAGTGPGGRNEIIYTPPAGGGEGDFFHYTVVDSTGRSDFGAVHVTSAFIGVNTGQDFYSYDPGTTDSPVFNNPVQAVRLTPQTIGDVSWSAPVQAVDRGDSAGNAYNRDLIFGTSAVTWSHKIENGRWQVTVNMSDPSNNLDNMYVNGEGQPGLTDLDRPIGTNNTVSFEVDVLDGELNLEFGDADTVNPLWAVNRINLQQLEAFVAPLLEGDYNEDGVVDAADYTVYLDALGQDVAAPFDGADGNGSGTIDAGDRDVWAANYGAELVTVPLINATLGNGEFAVDNLGDASSVGGGTETLSVILERDRALRGTSGANRGVAVLGWEVRRDSYNGGNPALGVDGNYGFATDAGTGPGQTGQAFVNSGDASVVSDAISRDFFAGESLQLSYLLGTDAGATTEVEATVSLLFDVGLPTARTHNFAVRSATGLTTPAITEEYTLAAPATTLSVQFIIGGVEVGRRALLDSVVLDLTTSSALAASASSAVASPLTAVAASETAAQEVDATEEAPTQDTGVRQRVGFAAVRGAFRSAELTVASRDSVLAVSAASDQSDLLLHATVGVAQEDDSLAEALAASEEDAADAAFDSLGDNLLASAF